MFGCNSCTVHSVSLPIADLDSVVLPVVFCVELSTDCAAKLAEVSVKNLSAKPTGETSSKQLAYVYHEAGYY